MSPEVEPSLAELGWRMQALEKMMTEGARHADGRFDAIQSAINGLSFVPRGEYIVEMRSLAEKVESARALAQWCLGAIVSGILIAILVTLVLRSA